MNKCPTISEADIDTAIRAFHVALQEKPYTPEVWRKAMRAALETTCQSPLDLIKKPHEGQ